MQDKDDPDLGKIRLSFVDVIYGIVIAYGFNFVDKMNEVNQYALFLLAFIAIVFDWVFVHQPYWKKIGDYKDIILIIDLVVLFLFSRIFAATTSSTPNILLLFSILFLLYATWDLVFRRQLSAVDRNWQKDFASDSIMSVVLAILWALIQFESSIASFLNQPFIGIKGWIWISYTVYMLYFCVSFNWPNFLKNKRAA